MAHTRRHPLCFPLALTLVAFCGAVHAQSSRSDYDVSVDIENTTPEKKTKWPVIMTVYKLFGRNLPAGTMDPKGYHVYNEKGEEIEHMIEAVPPYDQPGNSEIVWIVPDRAAKDNEACAAFFQIRVFIPSFQ